MMSEDKWRIWRQTYPKSGKREDPQGFYHVWYSCPPEWEEPYIEGVGNWKRHESWQDAYDYVYRKTTKQRLVSEFSYYLFTNWDNALRVLRYYRWGDDSNTPVSDLFEGA